MMAKTAKSPPFLGGLPRAKWPRLWQHIRAASARGREDAEGFADFYRLLFGRGLPRHAAEEWLPALYEAVAAREGLIIEAFRGSSKTTTLSVAWLAYRVGHHPAASHLVVAGSDESARGIAAQAAWIIAASRAWKLTFPHVKPDRERGWSATAGWNVRDTRGSKAAWARQALAARGKDASLAGVGYRSGQLIGKHPGGTLVVDDLHDEFNSRDGRELEKAREVLTGTLLPTLNPETAQLFVGTPWSANDGLAYLKSTGRYRTVKTPVWRAAKGRQAPAASLSKKTKKSASDGPNAEEPNYVATWPQRFPLAEIEKRRAQVGTAQFARMYQLDLAAAAGAHLRSEWLGRVPLASVDPRQPVYLGVDYASSAVDDPRGDYFAAAVGRALADGEGVAVVDGVRARLSQAKAEEEVLRLAARYPTLKMVAVEAVGKGEEFYHLLSRRAGLPLVAMRPGRHSKAVRFERGMAPAFEGRRAWVLDVETEFLRAFQEEWAAFPHGQHDDTLDAVYWMLTAAQGNLLQREKASKRRAANPLLAFGKI
jgi:phage terminase large subunit-like protein